MTRRDEIVSAARSWIGTPYKHQHSTKGAGCDCLGLVRGVWREVIGPEPEPTPPYSASWGLGDKDEVLLRVSARHMVNVEIEDMQAGDVIVFRMRENMTAKHCGIYTGLGYMVHAYQGAGVVSEHFLGSSWRRRIAGVFRMPGA